MKSHEFLLLVLFFIIFILFGPLQAKALRSNTQVGILQWAEFSAAYPSTYEVFIEGMKEQGCGESDHLHVDIKITEADRETALTIAREFVKKKVDLICGLGAVPS